MIESYPILVKPLDVKIVSKLDKLVAGKRTEIHCISSGSHPPAKISWWKGFDKMLNSGDSYSSSINSTQSTLYFTPEVSDNGNNLTCRADNPQMSHEVLEDTQTLHVQCKSE
jgi:sidestep protein, putative (fragment)